MKKTRSLAIISLGLACLLAAACQTAGTPGQSQAAAKTQATVDTSSPAKGTITQSQAAAESPVPPTRELASRARTTTPTAGVRPATAARQKGGVNGTLENSKKLYHVITGREISTTSIIDGGIAAAVIVLGIGAFVAAGVMRRRRLTPAASHAQR